MFIKRPKTTDSENDLLLMQRNFLGTENSFDGENVTEKLPQTVPKTINKVKKTSIFAQKYLNSSCKKAHLDSEEVKHCGHSKEELNGNKFLGVNESSYPKALHQVFPTASNQATPGNDDMDLFQKVIAEHSVEEILDEMKQLQSRFGPETMAFLKNRNKDKRNDFDISAVSKCSKETSDHLNKAQEILQEEVREDRKDGNENNIADAACKEPGFTSTDKLETKVSTRFGLYGEITTEESYTSELFHHGEEPERGGYTLQEIFLLVRSSYKQQQDFGLKMLSCIVKQAKLGSFHGRLSNSIIPVLVSGDAGLLARAALDSSAHTVIISAVEFLHALIVNSEDETALDHVFTWFRGYEQPVMNATSENLAKVEDSNKSDGGNSLNVEDVFKKDMVEGLLKMILLPRISYLLKLFKLHNAVVNNLLDIIIRICRHHHLHHEHDCSPYTLNYQQLADSIVAEFLPLKNGYHQMHGKIIVQSNVVRLLRILASSDGNIATYVFEKYADNVFQHLQTEDSPSCLYYESLRFFIVLLRYGLAYEKFKSRIPFIVTRLHALSRSPDEIYDTFEAALLLSFAEAGMNASPGEHEKEMDADLSELVSVVVKICKKCTDDFVSHYYMQKYSTSGLLASSLNCVATCFTKFHKKLSAEASQFKTLVLIPCLDSVSFERAVSFLRGNSPMTGGAEVLESLGESCTSFKTLGSLWADPSHVLESPPGETPQKKLVSSHLEVHQVTLIPPRSSAALRQASPSPLCPPNVKWHPVVDPLSTTSFMVAIARVALALAPCIGNDEFLMKMLKHREVNIYLSKFVSIRSNSALCRTWFSRFEAHFVYLIIKMAKQLACSSEHKRHLDLMHYHKVALNLLTSLHRGDEAMAVELIMDVIFCKEFLSDAFGVSETNTAQNFQSRFIIDTKRSSLIDFDNDISNNLSNMGNVYVQLFFNEGDIELSKNLLNGFGMKCMMAGVCEEKVMKCDWLLEPLRHLYDLKNQSKKNPELIDIVENLEQLSCHSIRALLFFEKCRPEVLHQIPDQLKFARLIQAVIAAGREMENGVTYSYLDQLLEVYIRNQRKHGTTVQCFLKELYESFLDVYLQFLGGIPVFDVMVLLPLFLFDDNGSLWQMMWLTKVEVARYLFLPLNQFPYNVDVLLKSRDVSNISFIKIFYHCLRMKWFTQTRTPIPYLIAIHHLNHFLFSNVETTKCDQDMKKLVVKEINNWEEPVKSHVLLYKQVDSKNDIGFGLYATLTNTRLKQFAKLTL